MGTMFFYGGPLHDIGDEIQCPAYRSVSSLAPFGGTPMAIVKRRGKRKDSTSSYFRQVLRENPELLHSTSNEELINRWKADNPHHNGRILKKVKQRLANLKSVLRRKERGGPGGRGKSTSRG